MAFNRMHTNIHTNTKKEYWHLPSSLVHSVCAPVHVRGWVYRCGLRGLQYYADTLFLRFYVYIFINLVQHNVLTLAHEISCYINDYYSITYMQLSCTL